MFNSRITSTNTRSTHREEEEEEEEDGDDEGLVEEQLSRHEPDNHSNASSPHAKTTGTADAHSQQDDPDSQERKRRPGRPRGSKNRKPRAGQTSKQEPVFYSAPAAAAAAPPPPQHPDVNAQNQHYYEFQWRVLNLCSEFYTAAEELILMMLSNPEPKLNNPSQLVGTPPPPIYTPTPTFYQSIQAQPVGSTSNSASIGARPPASSSKSATPSAVASNTTSFIMPTQPAYPQYPMYAGQYPTTPYYQYPYVTAGAYYPQPQPQMSPPAQPQPAVAQPQPAPVHQEASTSTGVIGNAANVITMGTGAGGNQGAWSDEETERLKKSAEESRTGSQNGEIDWDRVVGQWGSGRTRFVLIDSHTQTNTKMMLLPSRHQILIKATSLGLKESSSRGVKRRRENDGTSDAASPSVPHTPTGTHVGTTVIPATSNPPAPSPAHSQTITPAASPALQNQQRPPSKSNAGLPWPMPTVAANTTSPVIAASTITAHDQQRTSYYRARPNQDVSKSTTPVTTHAHPYMFQPNGNAGSSSRLGNENGK
ncbi:hypothetical protein C0991_011685 [Blastosporella zonata]|nr:hypothetical protein C0991_011685 [Blastosporella zonata]